MDFLLEHIKIKEVLYKSSVSLGVCQRAGNVEIMSFCRPSDKRIAATQGALEGISKKN